MDYTPKEAKFIKFKLAGESSTRAAKLAGYSEKSAHVTGNALMKKPHIRDAVLVTLESLGITFQKAVKPVSDALGADKIVIRKRTVVRENGDIGEEEFVDTEPDHSVRLKASSMALDLLGLKHGHSVNSSKSVPDKMSPELSNALKSGDEVELQRAIFRRS